MAHYDVNDPADLQVLVNSGLIWKGGPKTVQKAIDAITDGTVQRAPDKEPPQVRQFLDMVEAGPDAGSPEPTPVTEDELAAAPPAAEELPE
jgi:hypothetical protein